MLRSVSCAFLVLVLASFVVENSAADLSEFWENKACSTNDDCRDSAADNGLTCQGSKCACTSPKRFYYGTQGKCLLPFGAKCDLATLPTDITPRGKCDTTAQKVVCDSPKYKDDGLECVLDTGTCSVDDECNESKFQTCNPPSAPGRCGCPDGSEFISGEKCQLKLLDKSCKKEITPWTPECLAFSECINVLPDPVTEKLQCACKHGLRKNADGHCKIAHDHECQTTPIADDPVCDIKYHQTCQTVGSTSRCRCIEEGTKSWYNAETTPSGTPLKPPGKECQLLIGAPCSATTGPECTHAFEDWSSCKSADGTAAPTCICEEGLVVSKDKRKCFNPLGALCEVPGMNYAKCSEDENLTCETVPSDNIKRCGCKASDSKWYDPDQKSCSILVGGTRTSGDDVAPCVSHAWYNDTDPDSTKAKCECEDRFAPDKNGECRLIFGEACDADHPETGKCDNLKFQKCSAATGLGRCECDDPVNMIYEDGVCKLKAQQTCSTGAGPSCAEHSYCNGTTCNCEGAKTPNARGKCVGKLDAPCTKLSDCDAEAFLECSLNGKCACANANAEYNPTDEKCYLKLDSPCEVGVGAQCATDKLECLGGKCGCSKTKELILDNSDPAAPTCGRTLNTTCEIAPDNFKCSVSAHLECQGSYCVCATGYKSDGNATHPRCGADYSSTCASSTDCRQGTDLLCSTTSKKCECLETDPWDPLLQKCGAAQFTLSLGVALIALFTYLSKYY